MTTPTIKYYPGTNPSVTTNNSITNNSAAIGTDGLNINNTSYMWYADFFLTCTFSAAPVTGNIQLIEIPRNGGTQQSWTLSSGYPTIQGIIRNFSPQPLAGNVLTTMTFEIGQILINQNSDYYIFNNATGVSMNSGAVLSAQLYTPGQ
jgi:hypothetical protein